MGKTHGESKTVIWNETYKPLCNMVMEIVF